MPAHHPLPQSTPENTTRAWWAPLAGLLATGLVASLVACGGGGGSSAGVGTGGTGSFAVGSISGLGSIIVNGVRYDDSSASVEDDDGTAGSTSSLSIGQVVEVHGSVNSDGVSGKATRVTYYSELRGPVTAINVGAGTVTVFGQVVKVTPTTVFLGASDLTGLAVGNVVEVYGLPDASGVITATRINREANTISAYSSDFRMRGVISGLSGTAPNQRFTMGTVTVQLDSSTDVHDVNGTIVDGAFAKVRLDKTVNLDGSYTAVRVQIKTRTFDSDVQKAELEGLVSEFTSASAAFKVNGYPAQLGSSVTYEGGVVGDLADGVRIEAKGVVTGGVLIVGKVEFKNESDDGGSDGSSAPFEFHGTATCSVTPCASPAGSITVHGLTVQYDASTHFGSGLSLSNLNGANVEVKAIAQSGSSGTTLLATRIKLDN